MNEPTTTGSSLIVKILDEIEDISLKCEEVDRPLELDPAREQLFQLFVMAEGSGLLEEDEPVLSAENLCVELADRWQLAAATKESFFSQQKLPPEQLSKMRLLWSLMRMWMEWTYAWRRWPEFHANGN